MFGRTVSGFGSRAKRSSGSPLAITGTITGVQLTRANFDVEVPGGGAETTVAGLIDVTAVPSGGDGSYSLLWSVTEVLDVGGNIAIADLGTRTSAQYDTLRITVTAGDGSGQAIYMLQCTVTDGTGATATIQANSGNGVRIDIAEVLA